MNQTIANTLTSAKAELYFSTNLFLYIIFLLTNIIVSYIVFSHKTNWGKVWTVWILTAIITGIFLTFIVASPEQILNFKNWIKEFLGI